MEYIPFTMSQPNPSNSAPFSNGTRTSASPNDNMPISSVRCPCNSITMRTYNLVEKTYLKLFSDEYLIPTETSGNPTPTSRQQPLDSVDTSPKRRKTQDVSAALKSFLSNPDAGFYSQHQRQAIEMACAPQKDAIISLSTGVGKSPTFLLAAFMDLGKVNVIIAPLISFQQSMKNLAISLPFQLENSPNSASITHSFPDYKKYLGCTDSIAQNKLHCRRCILDSFTEVINSRRAYLHNDLEYFDVCLSSYQTILRPSVPSSLPPRPVSHPVLPIANPPPITPRHSSTLFIQTYFG